MRINFTKMHGAGNDFIIFDAPRDTPALSSGQLRSLADRRTGIGFDQALVLHPARRTDTAVYYQIFNSDGAEVEQCGNGARCIAALLYRQGRAPGGEFVMDSPGGLVRARVERDERVAVEMGVPSFEPAALPFDAAERQERYALKAGDDTFEIGAVSIGNPHAVLQVAAVDAAPVASLGPVIEGHRRFPRRVNVGFMEVVDRSDIRLRVYERGAGETLACGTGACAAVIVGRQRGLLDSPVRVHVRGGELRVDWAGPGEPVWLTGPAEVAFEGHFDVHN
ncbi:MAG TPA: diaminopimelate epimerase [Steroidobacteraceae bacterium]|jgi:diaminopimelate epimerase|nr:diaminopimelate epimerase [Steroidobacteraceae bacterium]